MNDCVFSSCRRYRYLLIHRWDELLLPRRRVIWICLNPGSATETKVDSTWRRIRAFSATWGFNEFALVNLFAFRTIHPRELKQALEPVGERNDFWIKATATNKAEFVVVAWGAHGAYRERDRAVFKLLGSCREFYCLGKTQAGCPRHPLYIERNRALERY